MRINENFPARLRELVARSFNGRYTRLARKAGIPASSIKNYLNGVNRPGFAQLVRIIEYSSVNPTWLLTGEGPMFEEQAVESNLEQQSTNVAKGGYLEAAKIIAALQERIEQLDSELAKFRIKRENPFGSDQVLAVWNDLPGEKRQSVEWIILAGGNRPIQEKK